jgi:hypothetical protein
MIDKTFAEQFQAHHWEVEIEIGRVRLICTDPCPMFECKEGCSSRKKPGVLQFGRTFNLVEESEDCDCGQRELFLEDYERREGKLCACMDDTASEGICGVLPVRVRYVDESTPSGPWGPAEYSYYLELLSKDG